jgi:hypothetical protein
MYVPRSLFLSLGGIFASVVFPLLSIAEETPRVRSSAVVDLPFDEEQGPALDAATVGQSADAARFVNEPVRVTSPFWNQSGKRAVLLDAARAQYLELADSPDLDRPQAVSISLLAVNLVAPNDTAFRGLFAKRGTGADGKVSTNYGINFTMQNDQGQFYIHDGVGFRVAAYSVKELLPPRKLVHLTAVLEVADAPGADADTEADDVRLQVFVNGRALTPKSVTNGFVDGTNAWTTDVQVAGLVNDIPLAIGRSDAAGEYFSGVVDEFCLFPSALTPEQALKLFHEVAGANVDELIQQDQPVPLVRPEITRINPPALVVGQTTQLAIVGKNLLPAPRVTVPVPGTTVELVGEPTAERLTARVSVPADAVPAIVPVWVTTQQGVTAAELVAVDHLPLRNIQQVSADSPATLPAAYWGTLQGANVVRLEFPGQAGQRFVADVELQRLGGKAEPVLELKNPQGAPLTIAWGQSWLGGDARIETTLPVDGRYTLELHDLVYRAPGPNPFRLKVGDLQLIDLPFPVASPAGTVTIEPVGVGFAPGTRWSTTLAAPERSPMAPLPLPADLRVPGPRPLVRVSDAMEIVEAEPSGELPSVVATFAEGNRRAVGINGRLRQPLERDRFLVQVTPGQKLRFTLQSRSLGSTLYGEIALLAHPAGNLLAVTSDQPSETDPRLEFTVPEGMQQIQVAVRDLFGRGGERAVYRLEIAPAELPVFDLAVNTSVLSLPADGSAIVELTLNRGGYNGPVALRIDGDDGLRIAPEEIPQGVAGKILCRIRRAAPSAAADPALIRIVGTSVGVEPATSVSAVLTGSATAPAFRDTLAIGQLDPGGLQVELLQPPTKLFRGVTQRLPVKIQRAAGTSAAGLPVRFTSQSTEAVRPRQPGNPAAGNFPLVAVVPAQVAPAEAEQFDVALTTPLEAVEPVLQIVLTAEAVLHAYSERVLASAHAEPFRVTIENAVAPKVDAGSLQVVAGADHAVTGTLQRTAGFAEPVEVTLVGLPEGYQITPALVPADQDAFRIVVKSPPVNAETALPNVKLRVTSRGAPLAADADVALRVAPQ